jgi:tape measure domain-containing protein
MAGKSATLAVKIITDASGASKGLDQASAKVGNFNDNLNKKASPAGKSVGSSLVKGFDNVLGTGLKIAGGAGAVLLGTALTKGMGRLTALDNAKAKLSGLGHSADEVEKIMSNATAAVKGTAFGLGDAATVAASVVAAGVKPGKDLEGVLTTVADTATIAGSSMEDMGSIFGKVAASNKLSGDTVSQITDRGVPALQLLAKHYGTTAAKASEMVSKGKVDFKNFESAMKEGVGGAAKDSGKTFEGAWANVLAALGRIGENLLSPLFDESKSVLQQLPELLSGVEDKAKSVGEAIAKVVDWVKKNTALLKTLGVVAASVFAGMLVIRTVIAAWRAYQAVMAVVKAAQLGFAAASYGTAAATSYMTAATTAQKVALLAGAAAQKIVTAAQWAWNAAINANPIGLIIVAVIALVAAFVLLWKKCDGFKNFILGMWKAIQTAAAATWSGIKSITSSVLSWLKSAVKAAGNVINAVWNGIKAAATTVWNGIKAVVRVVVAGIRAYITAYKAVVLAVWSAIRSSASAAWSGIKAVVSAVVGWIKSAIRGVRDVVNGVWSAIRSSAAVAWGAIKGNIAGIANGIKGTVRGIRDAANTAWSSIRGAASRAFGPIKTTIDGIKGAIDKVVGAVQSLIGWLGRIHMPKISFPKPPSWLSKLNPFKATYNPALAGGGTTAGGVTASPTLRGVMAGNTTAGGASGPSIVFNINGVLDGPDAARRVRRVIRNDDRRRAGVVVDASSARRTR